MNVLNSSIHTCVSQDWVVARGIWLQWIKPRLAFSAQVKVPSDSVLKAEWVLVPNCQAVSQYMATDTATSACNVLKTLTNAQCLSLRRSSMFTCSGQLTARSCKGLQCRLTDACEVVYRHKDVTRIKYGVWFSLDEGQAPGGRSHRR